MKIVLASSEAVPFSKTGGLADVASSLPRALAEAGHEVTLITPYYPQHFPGRETQADSHPILPLEETGRTIGVSVAGKRVSGKVLKSRLPESGVSVLLVEQGEYFDRPGLYQQEGSDYKDNCERFVFFSRAVLDTARAFGLRPEIIHANDWQTGLVPILLKVEAGGSPDFGGTACVFTIHNLAYQGRFWHWDMLLTGLEWKYFNWREMEFHGSLNLLKTGIVFADAITTVSPTYAREIQTEEFGCGLQGVLRQRAEDLFGILNGVDVRHWNPRTDPALIRNYSAEDYQEGKAACKLHLQKLLNLPVSQGTPLFGMISRLSEQKGLDLILEAAGQMLAEEAQFCFLGTGNPEYEAALESLAKEQPEKVATMVGFDETLAHRIEAGSDAYLMPSRYEPCGLNQMYSMIYGTVPLVRAVGGLADSVVDATEETIVAGTATGFSFESYDVPSLLEAFRRSLRCHSQREQWGRILQNGMKQDWSWNRSAGEYLRVYEHALAKIGSDPRRRTSSSV